MVLVSSLERFDRPPSTGLAELSPNSQFTVHDDRTEYGVLVHTYRVLHISGQPLLGPSPAIAQLLQRIAPRPCPIKRPRTYSSAMQPCNHASFRVGGCRNEEDRIAWPAWPDGWAGIVIIPLPHPRMQRWARLKGSLRISPKRTFNVHRQQAFATFFTVPCLRTQVLWPITWSCLATCHTHMQGFLQSSST